jgi:hypothetical protein
MSSAPADVPAFVPGKELARAYYEEVVADLAGENEHSAALLGSGSDVLGFDTERSTDHAWGPRLQVFVRHEQEVEPLRRAIESGLPEDFRGWPTRFGWDEQPVVSRVQVVPLGEWLRSYLGFDPREG